MSCNAIELWKCYVVELLFGLMGCAAVVLLDLQNVELVWLYL